jgi:hypothetical protein
LLQIETADGGDGAGGGKTGRRLFFSLRRSRQVARTEDATPPITLPPRLPAIKLIGPPPGMVAAAIIMPLLVIDAIPPLPAATAAMDALPVSMPVRAPAMLHAAKTAIEPSRNSRRKMLDDIARGRILN